MEAVAKLRSLCQKLRTVQAEWAKQPMAEVSVAVVFAIEAVINFVGETMDWPDDIEVKRLVLECDELKSQYERWVELRNDDLNGDRYAGGMPTLWASVGRINNIMDEPFSFPACEPPDELAAMPGMSHRQIARMYDWYLPNGQPDVSAVATELANWHKKREWTRYSPGYVAESAMQKQREVEEKWAERTGHNAKLLAERATLNRPAPETLEDLLMLNPPPSINQIKLILKDSRPGLTDAEIKLTAAQFNITLTQSNSPRYYDKPTNLAEHEAQHEQENQEHARTQQVAATIDSGTDIDDVILDLKEQGLTCNKIAAALNVKNIYGKWSAQSVGKRLSALAQEELAAEGIE